MSRSGYSEDCDGWDLVRWRGAVASAIRGARGQAALRELLAALDALPEKRLAADSLMTAEGEFCTLGALGKARGIDLASIDPDDRQAVAEAFGVAEALAAEIMYLNDEHISTYHWVTEHLEGPARPGYPDFGRLQRTVCVEDNGAPERRWHYMRNWVAKQIEGQPQ